MGQHLKKSWIDPIIIIFSCNRASYLLATPLTSLGGSRRSAPRRKEAVLGSLKQRNRVVNTL